MDDFPGGYLYGVLLGVVFVLVPAVMFVDSSAALFRKAEEACKQANAEILSFDSFDVTCTNNITVRYRK